MSVFVDWISIKQRHPGRLDPETGELVPSLPMVDSGLIGKFPRSDTGAYSSDISEYDDSPEWVMQSSLQHRGSFDSLVIVKCDGFTVTLSGNVGRLDRPDNLFNLDFDATIQKCNEILASYGLPPFTAGEQVLNPNPSDYDVKHGLFEMWTGATVSMLHLTRNYSAGSPQNAQTVIDWLSTQSMSRIKRGKAGDTSVQWGGKGGRKLLKAYLKALEMLIHRHGRKREEVQADPVYQYCHQTGVVRLELEAGRLLLRDNLLRYLGDITMSKLIQLFDNEVTPLLGRTKTDVTRMELEHLPPAVRMTASAYLRGENVQALLARTTFYRHAKTLRDYGLDIAEPLPTLTKFSTVIRVVDLTPLTAAPDWYWNHQRRAALTAVPSAIEERAVA